MADLIDARLERQLQRPISRLLRLKWSVEKVCARFQKTGPLIGEVRRAVSGAMPMPKTPFARKD